MRNQVSFELTDHLYKAIVKTLIQIEPEAQLARNAKIAVDGHITHVIDRFAQQIVNNSAMQLLAHSIAMKADAPLARRNEIINVYNKISASLTAHDLVCRTLMNEPSVIFGLWHVLYPAPNARLYDLVGRPVLL